MSNQNNNGAENWTKLTEQEEGNVLGGFAKASDRANVKPTDDTGTNVIPTSGIVPPIVPEGIDPVNPFQKPIPPTVDTTPAPVSDSGQ